MKLLVYGGAFNPIHNGHTHLAREFARRVGAERVLLVPSRVPPHKAAPYLAKARHRLAMCRLAALAEGFSVSDMELRRSGKSYTADTLQELHKKEPDAELYFLMGGDMFLTLREWHAPQEICALAVLCAAPRGENDMPALIDYAKTLEPLGARCVLEAVPYLPFSSTGMREALRRGENINDMVPPGVAEYIARHHLYLEE